MVIAFRRHPRPPLRCRAPDTSIPLYFESHLKNVASGVPCLRHNPFAPIPAWRPLGMPSLGSMIQMFLSGSD